MPEFPRKPFLDRVIVEVTPIEKIFEQSEVKIDLQNATTNARSDRGIVESCVGDGVTQWAASFLRCRSR